MEEGEINEFGNTEVESIIHQCRRLYALNQELGNIAPPKYFSGLIPYIGSFSEIDQAIYIFGIDSQKQSLIQKLFEKYDVTQINRLTSISCLVYFSTASQCERALISLTSPIPTLEPWKWCNASAKLKTSVSLLMRPATCDDQLVSGSSATTTYFDYLNAFSLRTDKDPPLWDPSSNGIDTAAAEDFERQASYNSDTTRPINLKEKNSGRVIKLKTSPAILNERSSSSRSNTETNESCCTCDGNLRAWQDDFCEVHGKTASSYRPYRARRNHKYRYNPMGFSRS